MICRRSEQEPRSGGGRVALAALGLLLAAVAGAIVVKRKPFASAGVATASSAAAVVATNEDEAPNPTQPPAPFPVVTGRTVEARQPAPRPRPSTERTVDTAAAAPSADEEARARVAELAAAMQRVPIRMYTTDWCPVCRKAKAYMMEKRISFVEIDVEASPDARRRFRALNPRGGVPTIDVDGEVLVGFGPDHLQEAIRRAAQRRLDR